MTADLAAVLALLAITVAMFSLNRPRMDAVALIMMTALPLTGVITMNEALAGFSDPNVILIAALFVIGEGLVRTGVAQRLGDSLAKSAGRNETRMIAFLMVIVAGVGAFMSSTGVVAIFIPVVLRIAQNSGVAPGRLLMPLSMAALISGMMTLVATAPNLVVNSELARHGHEGFGFFAFTPFGLPILILAVGYMVFARRWLVSRMDANRKATMLPRFATWVSEYSLAGRGHRLAIMEGSPLAGKRIDELRLRATAGVDIIAIERRKYFNRQTLKPSADVQLESGDILFVATAPASDIAAFAHKNALTILPIEGRDFADRSHAVGMAELIVPATSKLIGKTIVQAAIRTHYGLSVVGLKRGKKAFAGNLRDEPLKLGDTLLVAGPWHAIELLRSPADDLVILKVAAEIDEQVPAAMRAPFSLGVLALVVAAMMTGIVPNVQAALMGCLLLGLFRCVDMNAAYRSIHWQTLVVIVGMLPFSLALQKTGGIDLASGLLIDALGNAQPHVMLAALFAATAALGLFISNTATAVLMAPVALSVAAQLGASPYPFVMTVALAASAAFMTPVSSPVNTLVVGPGNYTFLDFVRVGVPFTLAVMVTVVILVPLVFPFQAEALVAAQ
jgi:di/tricarboxylate transporter